MEPGKKTRPRLFIFLEWFTPAYKAGGPIRSIHNLAELLADDVDIFICTGDRDLGDEEPFQVSAFNQWIQHEKYAIMYCDPQHRSPASILKAVDMVMPDIVYMNSMYGYQFSLLPLFVLKRDGFAGRIILAPRGMLKSTAIQFKSLKKKVFLYILRRSGLLRGIFFHATDDQEETDIQRWLRVDPRLIYKVPNAPWIVDRLEPIEKQKGEVRLLFVGRIHPIKGLDYILEILKRVSARVTLDIVGWMENRAYFQRCLAQVKSLPENVVVVWSSDMTFAEIIPHLRQTHMLVLPTHGENFGHAIFESLSFGRPVIISDETPWKNLYGRKAGWDISLKKPDEFLAAVETAASMDQYEFDQWSRAAYDYAKEFIETTKTKQRYGDMFGLSPKTP